MALLMIRAHAMIKTTGMANAHSHPILVVRLETPRRGRAYLCLILTIAIIAAMTPRRIKLLVERPSHGRKRTRVSMIWLDLGLGVDCSCMAKPKAVKKKPLSNPQPGQPMVNQNVFMNPSLPSLRSKLRVAQFRLFGYVLHVDLLAGAISTHIVLGSIRLIAAEKEA